MVSLLFRKSLVVIRLLLGQIGADIGFDIVLRKRLAIIVDDNCITKFRIFIFKDCNLGVSVFG